MIGRHVRWIAWLDLAVTSLFIFPAVASAFLALLMTLESAVFGPARVMAAPAASWFIFVSLTGILGVVWAVARLITNDDRLVLLDAGARVAVAALLLEALFFRSLPLVFGAFVATELIGSVVVGALWRAARQRKAGPGAA
jgi:hypothetical protein